MDNRGYIFSLEFSNPEDQENIILERASVDNNVPIFSNCGGNHEVTVILRVINKPFTRYRQLETEGKPISATVCGVKGELYILATESEHFGGLPNPVYIRLKCIFIKNQ